MSSVVYQKNKSNGNVYAYESVSYRDPVSRKPKSKRTYLGRVDPDTGMIIPKGKDGKRNRSKSEKYARKLPDDFLEEMELLKKQNADLQNEVADLRKKNKTRDKIILQMKQLMENYEAIHNSK